MDTTKMGLLSFAVVVLLGLFVYWLYTNNHLDQIKQKLFNDDKVVVVEPVPEPKQDAMNDPGTNQEEKSGSGWAYAATALIIVAILSYFLLRRGNAAEIKIPEKFMTEAMLGKAADDLIQHTSALILDKKPVHLIKMNLKKLEEMRASNLKRMEDEVDGSQRSQFLGIIDDGLEETITLAKEHIRLDETLHNALNAVEGRRKEATGKMD